MAIKAVGNSNGKHLYRFKFWGRHNIILPQKEMIALRGGPSPANLKQAQLLFEKDRLRILAVFSPQKKIPGNLYAALELEIRGRRASGSLQFFPSLTERFPGEIKLDREFEIKRFLFNPSKWIYSLRALEKITLFLGDYGKFKSLDMFSPLCAATFTKTGKRWS